MGRGKCKLSIGIINMEMVRVNVNFFSDDVIEKHRTFSPLTIYIKGCSDYNRFSYN